MTDAGGCFPFHQRLLTYESSPHPVSLQEGLNLTHPATCRLTLHGPRLDFIAAVASSIFKLAQGVFIAPQPLEALYADSEVIQHCFLFPVAGARNVSAAVVLAPRHAADPSPQVRVARKMQCQGCPVCGNRAVTFAYCRTNVRQHPLCTAL